MRLIKLNDKRQKVLKRLEITEKPLPVFVGQSDANNNLIAEIENNIRSLMRKLADLELTASEKERQHTNEIQKFLLRILEVVDSFEQLFENIAGKQDNVDRQTKIWIGNFRTIYRFLKSIVDEQGVIEIEIIDWSFDPRWHHVVETKADPSRGDGVIIRQTKKGYLWRNQLLRKAEVIVVRNDDEVEEE